MTSRTASRPLDVGRLATAIEDFNAVFIRLPRVERWSFSTLSVLHTLSRRGPTRLTALLLTEQIKQPALTALVAKLEREGLVSRRADPSDGRAVLLSITAAGERVVQSRHTSRVELLTRLVQGLEDHDRAVLVETARVLSHIVEIAKYPAESPAHAPNTRPRQRRALPQ